VRQARFSIRQVRGVPHVEVTHDGTVPDPGIEVPALWLRERSQLPSQRDLVSGQRLFDPHLLDADLALTEARIDDDVLMACFTDGHAEAYPLDALAQALHEDDDGCPAPVAWRAGAVVPRSHGWDDLADDPALLAAIEDLLVHGVIVVHGTPTDEGSVLEVAGRFGHVRETNFGRLFDVRSVPGSNDLAYRAVGLGPHTDNPYRAPVPGIQLLHCLVNETEGGLSTLVDAIADTDLVARRPVVAVDDLGRVTGLHYSPRLDQLPLMSSAATRAYQMARGRLARLLQDPAFEVQVGLDAGEVLVFSNDRVLHGRTPFDPRDGRRHLQGCYIDQDAPRSRYRVLRRVLQRSEV
jgi:gamma-butyrobetaine dioxygenase